MCNTSIIARWIHSNTEDILPTAEVCTDLEIFFTKLLREIHRQWKWEAIDGVEPYHCEFLDNRSCRMTGLLWLVQDQLTVPFLMHLQADSHGEELTWCECRVGERGPGGMIRRTCKQLVKQIQTELPTESSIDWAYHVAFGEREDGID